MDWLVEAWWLPLLFQALHTLTAVLILAAVVLLVLRYSRVNRITVKFEVSRRDQAPGKVAGVTAQFQVNRRD